MPDISTVACAAPVTLRAFGRATIERRFELLMVICASQCKGVLGPDDGVEPFTARFSPGAMQRRPF
jgi:hypothetical protein